MSTSASSPSTPTTLTRPHPKVWQIALSSPPDHRLTPALLQSLADNLDQVEREWREAGGGSLLDPMSAMADTGKKTSTDKTKDARQSGNGAGALIITGSGRFFSNGLDYGSAMKNKRFFEEVFDPVFYRLLTFPLVTIAAINGHAFAGGMILALGCDFRLMTSGKGLMCMNEISFGSPLPNSFASFLSLRLPHPPHLRSTLLGMRFGQKELVGMGLVDEVVEESKLGERAVEVGVKEGERVGHGVWGMIKEQVYYPVMEASRSGRPVKFGPQVAQEFWDRVGKAKAKL